MVRMTELQLEFFRELCEPFSSNETSRVSGRGGKELTYIDKRALENRLDTVCGPHGWYPRYEATNRGYKCSLSIKVPLEDGTWEWIAKEDGAGFEEMGSYNKQTNEWEADVDNDEKSGYTNALRRAAQDAWGIGRDLYKKGQPAWMRGVTPARPQSPPRTETTTTQAPADPPAPRPAPSGNRDFQVPPPGKAVFAWSKRMEEHFKTQITKGMETEAKERGWGTKFGDWTAEQVDVICRGAMGYLRSLGHYAGEFDNLAPAPAPEPAATPAHAQSATVKSDKTALLKEVKALVSQQTGQAATDSQVRDAIQTVSAEVAGSNGQKGEVLKSLRECEDGIWIANMRVFVLNQIKLLEQTRPNGAAGEDDIPF